MNVRTPNAWLVAGVAAVVGTALGAAAAGVQAVVRPWKAGEVQTVAASGPQPKAETDATNHHFGTVGTGGTGEHAFVVRNTGDLPLKLTRGASSCSCTVADFESDEGGDPGAEKVVPVGGSTQVRLKWRGKGDGGPFRQQATIHTNDPRRPEIIFVVEGAVVPTWKAVPATVALPNVSVGSGATASIDLFTYAGEPPVVRSVTIDGADAERLFVLEAKPLDAAEVAAEPNAKGGFRIGVTLRPGLPIGRLNRAITAVFAAPEELTAVVPLEATVTGDLSLLGRAWDSERKRLLLGTVSGRTGQRVQIYLTAKGPHRELVKPVVRETVPACLEVTVGETSQVGTGGVCRTPLTIVVPAGSKPVNHIGSGAAPLGRIVLATGHPDTPELEIPVCLAIGP